MPERTTRSEARPEISALLKRISPDLSGIWPAMDFKNVDLPAPLAPIRRDDRSLLQIEVDAEQGLKVAISRYEISDLEHGRL